MLKVTMNASKNCLQLVVCNHWCVAALYYTCMACELVSCRITRMWATSLSVLPAIVNAQATVPLHQLLQAGGCDQIAAPA
jgi:hypothetical protein